MKAKILKEYLKLYSDEIEVVIKGVSGIDYVVRDEMIAQQTLIDKERKVCKLYIK